MDTIYDAKLLLVDDNAELLALLCEQLRAISEPPKAAPLPVSVLGQNSRS